MPRSRLRPLSQARAPAHAGPRRARRGRGEGVRSRGAWPADDAARRLDDARCGSRLRSPGLPWQRHARDGARLVEVGAQCCAIGFQARRGQVAVAGRGSRSRPARVSRSRGSSRPGASGLVVRTWTSRRPASRSRRATRLPRRKSLPARGKAAISASTGRRGRAARRPRAHRSRRGRRDARPPPARCPTGTGRRCSGGGR